eukprot:5078928-Pyramimonas_sp.AAC.1
MPNSQSRILAVGANGVREGGIFLERSDPGELLYYARIKSPLLTCRGHQSREGRENIPAGVTNHLLVRAIFDTKFGMFTFEEETRTFWFSLSAMEADPVQAELEFQLVGVVLGLVRTIKGGRC